MKVEYKALNQEGTVVTGALDADSERAAARRLKRQGLTPVTLNAPTAVVARAARPQRPPKGAEVLLVLHQLATLLHAGVSLDEAVSSLAESTPNPLLGSRLDEISSQLRRGVPFSTALKESSIPMPAYIVHLAEAGEMTGNLAGSLADGVRQMEYERQVNTELRNALIYPSILVVSGITAVMLIFILVVPKFTNLLSKSDSDIPLLAEVILRAGQFMNDNLALVGVMVGVLCLGAVLVFNRPALKQRFWDFLMRLPLVGPWLIEADTGRWAAMMSTLLASSVKLTRALDLAQQGVSGSRLRAGFSQVTKSVRAGASLADSLRENGAITATGYGLVKVGERSGELPSMLRSLADLYIESGRDRMKRFLALLEPVAIIVIGGVIGLIMAGIILAITSVNEISI